MSGTDPDGPRPSPDALGSLLRAWPVACVLGREFAVIEDKHWLASSLVLIVGSGSVWVRLGESPFKHLHSGDILIVSQPESIRATATLPDAVLETTLADWSATSDPLSPPSVLGIDLIQLARPHSQRMLPAPFVIEQDSYKHDHLAALLASLRATARSTATRSVRDAIATAVYLECLHRHLQSRPQEVAWLTGLFDAEIGPIVAALLEAPGRDWTVESLAETGGMSRSAFARKFRDLMGAAPIDFLVEVRMWQAARQLRNQSADLKTISREAGYQSPAAFSVAFKRWSGETPSDYRKGS
jgi:AraC-like DNA-binding protein